MHENLISLDQLPIGSMGVVKKLNATGSTRRRMLDLGLINNTVVESLLISPAGDPIAFKIRGAVIALRSIESSKILVEAVQQ